MFDLLVRLAGSDRLRREAGGHFYGLDFFAEVFEGAAGGAGEPGAFGGGGGDAGDEVGGFEADLASLEGVGDLVEAVAAAGEAELAAEGGAGHAEAFARVVCFAGEAEGLPPVKCEEAFCDAAKEQVAAGELGAVVTDACVECSDAGGEVVGIGGFAGIGSGGDRGAASELGFGLQVLEALHLRAPCGQFRFHLSGDIGLIGLVDVLGFVGFVGSLGLRGIAELEQGDGGFG